MYSNCPGSQRGLRGGTGYEPRGLPPGPPLSHWACHHSGVICIQMVIDKAPNNLFPSKVGLFLVGGGGPLIIALRKQGVGQNPLGQIEKYDHCID